MEIIVRKGEFDDLSGILNLIHELAQYEKAPAEVTITLEQLRKDGFGSRRLFEFIIAEHHSKIVGMAFYFFRYSTWKGKFLYLEDFIVTESYRGNGIGTELFNALMQVSLNEQCVGMSWQVLDWNEPALHFYQKYGAVLDSEWVNGKLMRSEIEKLLTKTS